MIRRASALLDLRSEDAARHLPVEITGVITVRTLPSPGFCLAEDGVGIFVQIDPTARRSEVDTSTLRMGDLVAVTGVTDPGTIAPIVSGRTIRVIGRADLPPTTMVTIAELMTGKYVAQRVALTGVVQRLNPPSNANQITSLDLVTQEGRLRAILSGSEARLDLGQWVDGEVRVAGVAQSLFNSRGELLGVRIQTNDPADFTLLVPARGDPWSAPPGDLRRLLPFSRAGYSLHRVRVHGTVLLSRPGEMLYLQQGDTAIQVRTSARDHLRPGDDVEVSGFVDRRVHVAGLENAAVRVLGAGPAIAPHAVAVGELFRMKGGAITGGADDFDGRLVSLRGFVEGIGPAGENDLEIQLRTAGRVVTGSVSQAVAGDLLKRAGPGAEVRMSGVCVAEPVSNTFPALNFPTTDRVRLILRDAGDVLVVRPVPWWNERRQRVLVGVTLVAALSILTWVIVLRRVVAKQSAIIARKTGQEVLLAERQRMARELHDTLNQHLTGARMQIESAAEDAADGELRESLHGAVGLLRYSEEETRRITWELRAHELEKDGLAGAVTALAREADCLGLAKVATSVIGEPRRLPGEAEFHILRIAQEALANALKHSGAERVEIVLAFALEHATLSVQDHGAGFDPETLAGVGTLHFGLIGLRERAARIGAVLTLRSSPGAGTLVSVTLPLISSRE